MSRGRRGLLWLGLLVLAGCTRTEDYLEVARAQQKAYKEVADVLDTIHDEKDMAAAQAELARKMERCEAIARKANALPKPPPPEAAARLQEESFFMQRAFERLAAEAKRVRALPGGTPFLKQYESPSFSFPAPE